MPDEVLLERNDGIAVVTLNRPQALNAMNAALRAALIDTMSALRTDDTILAVILTGAGDRAFSAGLDLKELSARGGSLGATIDADPNHNPILAVETCGKPVIAAINGVAITGGFELALACDIRIAATTARFADTHALVGVMPGWGLSQKLPRIIGLARSKELAFTGRFLDAETAGAWGLINRTVAPATLMAEARAMAKQIASLDPAFVRGYARLIDDGYCLPYQEALAHERRYSTAYNAAVTADDVARRRDGVIARGRAQPQPMTLPVSR